MNGAAIASTARIVPMARPSAVPAIAPVRNPAPTRSRLMPICSNMERPL